MGELINWILVYSLLSVADLFGMVGIILAIPPYVILKVIMIHFFHLLQLRFNQYAPQDNEYDINYNQDDLTSSE